MRRSFATMGEHAMPAHHPPETVSPKALERLQRAAFLLGALLAAGAAACVFIAARAPNLLFAGMQTYLCWCCIACVIQYFFLRAEVAGSRATQSGGALAVAKFAGFGQWVIFFPGLLFAAILLARLGHGVPLAALSPRVLRLAAVFFLAFGCALYFFMNFAAAVQARLRSSALNPVLHLTQLAFWACLAASGITFAFLSTVRDFSAWLAWPLFGLTALLVLDPLARWGLRFYQPRTLRGVAAPAGDSLLLDSVFGHRLGFGGAIHQFEHLVGAKVSEMWMLRFLRQSFGILLAAAFLLGWFSTCLTAVPVGSRGVSTLLGRYQAAALAPGLHFTYPWPIQELAIVETERVRSISLGADRDIPGPVLWNEPHAEGEKVCSWETGKASSPSACRSSTASPIPSRT